MLSFSREQITLDYKEKKNLVGSIQITNHSGSSAYFKFKVNRPKFYLVKPDRGILMASQTKRIQFTLHRQGLSEALNDKFKCYYAFTNQGFNPQSLSGFQDRPNTIKQRLMVRITNLPSGIQLLSAANADQRGSQLKSMGASGTPFNSTFKSRNSSTLEGLIKQKQDRVTILKKEIQSMQSDRTKSLSLSPTKGQKKQKSSALSIAAVGILGIALGIASSFFI